MSGNGTYNSGSFAPTTAGVYHWVASYSGSSPNTVVVTVMKMGRMRERTAARIDSRGSMPADYPRRGWAAHRKSTWA